MRSSHLSATQSSSWSAAASAQITHSFVSGKPCACPFCSWSLGQSASASSSRLLATGSVGRRLRTVCSGTQTLPQISFDDWWEVDPLLETRAMVFRTYRQTKPCFAAWGGVVAQVARSRQIMKKFFQQLRHDSAALAFSRWSAFVANQQIDKQKENMVYKRFKMFSQVQCLQLWRQAAATQAATRLRVKTIGFRIMNAGLNICFLTWAANVYICVKQRHITKRFVSLMTTGAMAECFDEWAALSIESIEKRKAESIMRSPPFWKPPRPQHMYNVTLWAMSQNTVCLTCLLCGSLTSSDDVHTTPTAGQSQLEFSIGSFTHLGKRTSSTGTFNTDHAPRRAAGAAGASARGVRGQSVLRSRRRR
jgi:hypothetical protein